MTRPFDPIRLEVYKNLFASIAEEMGVALCRTAYSPNIKERRDFSCAVFDAKGEMVSQAAHIAVHLGSLPLSVKSAVERVPMRAGDVVIVNDPFAGGTHLPDLTMVAPVCTPGTDTPLFFVANRAHHADIGGISPGSLPLSTEIFQEGIRIPPVRLMEEGRMRKDLLTLILSNVRTPREREGDLGAQIAATRIGERRIHEVCAKYGTDEVIRYMAELQDYAERMTRAAIREIPDGIYSFEDFLDDDGAGSGPVRIAATVSIRGDEAVLDFSGSDPQVRGSVNAIRAITLSAVFYVFRSLVGGEIPSNAGIMRPLRVITRPGTVVDAIFPAAVAAGNVETSQRITDVLLGALGKALPDRIPAASAGTMNNLTIGGIDPRTEEPFTYYETIGGGSGATPVRDGASAVQTHMTNTRNTPVEALEHAFPLRVARYAVRRGSGGDGRFLGGDGIVREVEFLAPATVTMISERRKRGPYGLAGGRPGMPGENRLLRRGGDRPLPGKFTVAVEGGDRLRVSTPGGGGYGTGKRERIGRFE
ncbi:MAG: hydantoinase B/oxoprolinase family protein [Deltaproteobacteria bacterium]